MRKLYKKLKTIWIDGGFTSIALVSILTIIIVPFLPEGNSVINNCILS